MSRKTIEEIVQEVLADESLGSWEERLTRVGELERKQTDKALRNFFYTTAYAHGLHNKENTIEALNEFSERVARYSAQAHETERELRNMKDQQTTIRNFLGL